MLGGVVSVTIFLMVRDGDLGAAIGSAIGLCVFGGAKLRSVASWVIFDDGWFGFLTITLSRFGCNALVF